MTGWTHIFGPRAEGIEDAAAAAKRSDRRFVRSAGQLAVCYPDRRATGHVLTAWEAFSVFGVNVLEEALEYSAAILKRSETSAGEALKCRREALDLTLANVARAASVSEDVVAAAESSPPGAAMRDVNRIAFVLGLDERTLAWAPPGSDDKLATRLRVLRRPGTNSARPVSAGTALRLAEAASIVRIQHRLRSWLDGGEKRAEFEPDGFYGSQHTPAWQAGYDLAEKARSALDLGNGPIPSMRELVEERLAVPVVQVPLPGNIEIAGATVATTGAAGEVRGIVLNTQGPNENVWIRRATLAHELGHLLFDPEEELENLKIDSYAEGDMNPESADDVDSVERRANAFAIAFLAPNEAVRASSSSSLSERFVVETMHRFGIGPVAARHHIYNCHHRQYEVPNAGSAERPSDELRALENFAVDFFPLWDTSDQRRGRFAYSVAKCCKEGLISEHTAALYLQCTVEDLAMNLDALIDVYESPPGGTAL